MVNGEVGEVDVITAVIPRPGLEVAGRDWGLVSDRGLVQLGVQMELPGRWSVHDELWALCRTWLEGSMWEAE